MSTTVQHPLPPSGLQVRYSLPGDVETFTGREAELDAITAVIQQSAEGDGMVTIHGATVHAIDGMPGVGKTTLVVHAAHRLKHRFPDRCLFINLHAHTPGQDPVTPLDALGGLLTAVGVDFRYLPATLDERVALWRDKMAGQRALLILDNAADSRQVTSLLPGGRQCLVLVTSRRYLGDLDGGASIMPLDVLSDDQAQALFVRLAPRARGQSDAVGLIVDLAGHLPLAISLLARVYAKHPSWTLQALIEQTRHRLLAVRAENTTIAAAFDLSYATLSPPQQRLFTLLGLHPGTEIDSYAAAALAGIPLDEAADLLDDLYSARLLTEPSAEQPGRYGMHDLVRSYIRSRAATLSSSEQDQALDRLLDYYQRTAARADILLSPRTRPAPGEPDTTGSPGVSPMAPPLPDRAHALAWIRTERSNLLACLDHVTATRRHARVVTLTAALAGLLHQDGPWTEAITRHTTAAEAAQHTGDRLGQANAFYDLGRAWWLTGDSPQAASLLEQSLALYQELGDRFGQANALTTLGNVRWWTGDFAQAASLLEQALALYRDLGDRLGQANALTNLGNVRRLTGDYAQATSLLEQALALYRDLGDRLGQANAFTNLGEVRHQTGDYSQATSLREQALALYQDLGDRRGQANALLDLGRTWWRTGDYPQATSLLERALALYQDLGDRFGQANALANLGIVRRQTGEYPQATSLLEKGLTLYQDIDNRDGVVWALNELGTLCRLRGDLDQAEAHHRQALESAREIGSAWIEAHALAGLARCALATGHTRDARAGLDQAREIFHRIGAAEADEVAAELAALDPPSDGAIAAEHS
ncbi:tetratricopeptide repeat protein [Streptomyces sp. NPDC005065]|uniref:ATP-binding protein n=1 Tax=Streptomyces sp. NPDC005065 TaxID=3154461 RepID=UPI0033BCDA2E